MKNAIITIFIIIISLGAIYVYLKSPNPTTIPGEGQPYFPELPPHIKKISRIEIEGDSAHFNLTKKKDHWFYSDQEHPATPISIVKIKYFLFGLEEAKIIEPKSHNASNFDKMGIGTTHHHSKISLYDENDQAILNVFFGPEQKQSLDSNAMQLIARKQQSTQSYLISAALVPFSQRDFWVITEPTKENTHVKRTA